MKTERVKACCLLSRTLNFRETADNLFISQPTLTRQIESLEKEWGISLFRRNTRKVELTQEGQLLLEDARRLQEAEQNLFCHAALKKKALPQRLQ